MMINNRISYMPKRIVLLCGLPGAGKSTLANYIVEHVPNTKRIEYDQLSNADASIESWRAAREDAMAVLHQSIDLFDLILLDDNFYLRSMRKDIARSLQERTDVYFGMIYLQSDVLTCLERNRNRARTIPESIIRSMADRMEPPRDASPYYWDVNVLQLDTSNVDVVHDWDTIQDFIRHKLGPIPYPTVPTMTPAPLTLAQRRDAHWRLLVRTIGQSHPRLAPFANQARKHCLQSNDSTLDDFLSHGDWIPEEDLPNIRNEVEALGNPPIAEEET